MSIIGLILIIIVLIIIVSVIAFAIRIVPQSKAYVVERIGAYNRTCSVGLHILVPFLDRVANKVSLKEQVVDFAPQPVITKDNVTMQIDTVVYYQITDPRLFTYGVDRPINAIENLTATTLRNIIGDLELDETLTSRDIINSRMRSILDEATDPWGIKVHRVEVKNIIPPRDIQEAMEKQMKAERERRESILQAEGEKQSKILVAEGEKQSMILKADAAKQSRILEADGEAQIGELYFLGFADSEDIDLFGTDSVLLDMLDRWYTGINPGFPAHYTTEYIGNAMAVGKLIASLPLHEYIDMSSGTFSDKALVLQTAEEPYGLTVNYDFTKESPLDMTDEIAMTPIDTRSRQILSSGLNAYVVRQVYTNMNRLFDGIGNLGILTVNLQYTEDGEIRTETLSFTRDDFWL